jgi:agmatine/peptidylarginine deiminase
LLSFAAAGAFCLLLGLWSSVPAETESFTRVMYYNDTGSMAGNHTDHIDTVALWDRAQIVVQAKQDGSVKHYHEMSRLLNAVIEGDKSGDAASWHALSQMAPL